MKGRMKRPVCYFCFVCVYLVVCFSLHAIEIQPETLFTSANTFYSKGQYQDAINGYHTLIQNNQKNGAIYYNLGNAYFKLGKKGFALLNYERALQYLAYDEDLNANIQFVKEHLNLKNATIKRSWNKKVRVFITEKISVSTWVVVSYGLYLLCIVLGGISIFNMKFRKRTMVYILGILLCFFISISFLKNAYFIEKNTKKGIVVSPTVVRYSPSFSGAIAFELTEGMKVQIIRSNFSNNQEWKHIRLNEKQSGWVDSDDIVSL
jgi:tetratricopeptide (TPR) repeat protein